MPDGRIRDVARWVRYLPERVLHGRRRTAARKRLARYGPGARRVLFVCHGNICRSPFAAGVLRNALGEERRRSLEISSSGFYPEPERPSPSEAVRAARDLGVELGEHRSRVLSPGRPDAPFPLAFAMNRNQERKLRGRGFPAEAVFLLGDFDPRPISRRAIHDPFGDPPEVYERVFERIERCVRDAAVRLGGTTETRP